ncbi:MAG: hypothetical protein AYK18_12810 [Theionarchaea archaeon DG-70]|nr:MAG: hypothetical protein AYK18_12810 [Theionarchaea archaeon DG-70]
MKAKEFMKMILAGMIGTFLYESIMRFFPSFDILKRILSLIGGNLANYSSFVLFFLIISFFTLLYLGNQRGSGISSLAIPRKPQYIAEHGFHCSFGAVWNFLYGSAFIFDENYVYIEGPFCSRCSAKMILSSKNWIIWKTYLWMCPKCSSAVRRPTQFLYREDEIIKKRVERDLRTGDFVAVGKKEKLVLRDNTTYLYRN